MRKLILFCSVLVLGTAKPNGYFHQEYSYKSSSSAYKNNELQHKKDDSGFYSKDGDLEGRVKPKVNSESQHSEYTNPKLLSGSSGYQAGGYSADNSANYMASSDRLFGGINGQQGAVDGFASADRVLDLSNVYNTRGYGSRQGYGTNQGYSTLQAGGSYGGGSSNYGYTQGGSGYGYMQHGSSQASSGAYATNANLNSLMQRLQEDMTRQMEQAIYKQYQTSGYSTSTSSNQMNADIRYLEEELKRNLTRQLQDSLRTQYDGTSYSTIQSGTVPNYSNQEIAALTRRLEDDLINKLRQSVRTTYNRESSSSYVSSNTYRPVYPSSTLRPYYDRPVITTPNDIRYTLAPSRDVMSYPGSLVVETPIRYTPVPNPESLTQIASRTQTEINSYLDTALQNLYTTYLQTGRTSYYSIADFDNEVNRIKENIIRNLTYNLNDQISRNYGQQVLKDNYYYTVSSTGAISTQSNYNLRDYDSLKKQVEENLLRKLNQQVNTYRDQYQRQQSQYRETSSNSYAVTYRPVYYTSGSQLYDYSDLQRQLSQQLQNALNQHRYSQSSSYSASTSQNPQAYQISLDELSRELQRNLTEQLGSFRASSGSSSSYGYSSGSGSGNADFESMKNQLQNQLMQQLRQGLQNQYHYSASASYSASSSSSANGNYGMRQSYGSYPSTCLHGCGRRRRDLYQYSYNSGERRHGVKSMRRYSSTQAGSSDQSSSSYPRYLQHPEELSYPKTHTSSYSNHFSHNSGEHNSQRLEVEPDIVEDLSIMNHSTTSKASKKQTDQQQILEQIPNQPMRYAKQNVVTQQLEETQPLQNIQDDLTQQLELGHPTRQKIIKLENQNDLTQQLASGSSNILQHTIRHSHRLSRFDDDLEGQLTLGQQTLGQQLEDQNLVGYSHSLGQQNQETQNQLNLDQQTLGQQVEDQNLMGQLHDIPMIYDIRPRDHNLVGNSQVPRRHDQLNLDQQTQGQQLEDQSLVGQLHMSEDNDQEKQDQFNLDQQTLTQNSENQNFVGQLQVPKQNDQESLGQLYLEQQTSGQQLEDQNLIGQLRVSKHNDQEIEGQLSFGAPKNSDQEPNGQLTLGQESLGQQLENQYIIRSSQKPKHTLNFQEQQEGDDQNQEDLTQQLELEDIHKPKVLQMQQSEVPTQKLELGYVQKLRNLDQQLQEPYEQQINGDILEQSPDQQLTDLSQQLELVHPLHSKPKPFVIQLEPVQKSEQQVEDDSNVQKLEIEENQNNPQVPKINDDLTQQLEIEVLKNGKPDSAQQIQNQEDLDQTLDFHLPQTTLKTADQELQGQVEDNLSQKLEDLQKPNDQRPGSDFTQLVMQSNQDQQHIEDLSTGLFQGHRKNDLGIPQIYINKQPNIGDLSLEPTTLPEERLIDQKLGKPNEELEKPDQKLEEPGQQLEELDQQLEQKDLGPEHILPQQNIGNQRVEEDLNQILEQVPKKVNSAEQGQQLENDYTTLELVGSRKPKPIPQYIPTLESTLSFSPDIKPNTELVEQPRMVGIPSYQPISQSERNFRYHSQHSFENSISQNEHYPAATFGGSYHQESNQRGFTNGHSGHFTANNLPSLGSQTHIGTFENALKQQDALMDLLKKKVQEVQSSNKNFYGERTVKKTIFNNGEAMESQEASRSVKPIVELGGTSRMIDGQLGTYYPTDSFGYSRNNWKTTSNPTTLTGKTQWFTQQKGSETNPFTLFGTEGKGLTEFSGKATRRVVHYVNGKPVSESEKVQILKPNGEIIESTHNLPTDEINSFSHGISGTEFGLSGFDAPQTYINNQNSVSKHIIQRTSHYVNGKLVDFNSSSKDINPDGKITEVEELPRSEHSSQSFYNSRTKTPSYFGNIGY